MEENVRRVVVPRFYRPRPYQQACWGRRNSGRYNYYIKLWPRQCIAGGTEVWTIGGKTPIKDLRPGDLVYSLRVADGDVGYEARKVTDIWKSDVVKPCISVRGAVVSYDHPFFDGAGFTPLYQIVWEALGPDQRNRLRVLCKKHGQSLLDKIPESPAVLRGTSQDQWGLCVLREERVERCDLEVLDPVDLYDITVAVDHNFLIGDDGFVVSNSGKDADDIEHVLDYGWRHPGTRTAYVGLDNKWINENIFNKYIDGRRFWDDFPPEHIDPKDTAKEVIFHNNPEGMAEARIKFIGFQNDQALIGSSYDRFIISETSLYGNNAFQFIEPIWENKLAMGADLAVYLNGTPRGMNNVYTQMIQNYTGVDDPEEFPGEHINKQYRTYVDFLTIEDLMVPDGHGGWRRLYDDDWIEQMKDRYMRAYGDLNLFYQEFYCRFTTVNSGLVYKGIEQLRKEGRYCKFNLDTQSPVYVAFDISSKGKMTDATAGIVFQYTGGRMMVYDVIEERGEALVEVVSKLASRGYWEYVRVGFLPWDSDRSASSETPIEEADRMFPSVNWHALDKERIDRGIELVRRQLPNMWINSDRCDRLDKAFDAYEYKRLEKQDDWSATPMHNWASHLMDAVRYACMGLKEMDYIGLNAEGEPPEMPANYEYFGDVAGYDRPPKPITMMTEKERRRWLSDRGDSRGGYQAW